MIVKRKELGTTIMFFMIYIVYLICIQFFDDENSTLDDLRYVVALIGIIYGFVIMYYRRIKYGIKFRYGKDSRYIYIVIFLFYLISIMICRKNNISVLSRTYIELIYLLIPPLYTFCVVNLLSIKTINKVLSSILIISIIFYLCEKGLTTFFDISNWLSISFSKSYSPFESSKYSGISLVLFLYFLLFKGCGIDERERKKNNFVANLSFIFVLLTFKRLAVLVSICLILINHFINLKRNISKSIIFLTIIFLTIATIVYTKILLGVIHVDIDLYNFTTGRTYILSLWESYHFKSLGYGSSTYLINRYLEMDLVKIYMELGLIALFSFIFAYFSLVKNNLYSFIVLLFAFMNLLTASSLVNPFDWVISLLTVFMASSSKLHDENTKLYICKYRYVLKRK